MLSTTNGLTAQDHLLQCVSTQTFFNEKRANKLALIWEAVGNELWHRRMEHCTYGNIQDSFGCMAGIEFQRHRKFESHVQCPACMIAKASLV